MTPKVWRHKRRGRAIGSYYTSHKGKNVNLATQDPKEALARVRLLAAGKWSPVARAAKDEHAAEIAEAEEAAAAAAAVDEALAGEPAAVTPTPDSAPGAPPSAPPSPPPPTPPPPPTAEPITPEVISPAGWERDAADAAGEAEGAAPSMPAGDPSTWTPEQWEAAAKGIVAAKLWVIKWRLKKQYPAWNPPEIDAQAKDVLAKSWAQLLQYAGIDVLLPPWLVEMLEKLVAPGLTVIVCTTAIVEALKADAIAAQAAANAKAAAAGG